MFKLVKSEVLDLTLEVAQKFREMEPSVTERPLRPARVAHLLAKAADKKLVPFHWSVAFQNGKLLRMNGQHSSTALCKLNGNFPAGLKVHLDTFEVENEWDQADLFEQFDDIKSGRNSGEVAGSRMNAVPELRGKIKNVATGKLASEGIDWYLRIVRKQPDLPPGNARFHILRDKDYWPFIIWLDELFSSKTPELKPIQVIAAMYRSFDLNEEAAKAFWTSIARGGDQYDEQAADHVLAVWLLAVKEREIQLKSAQLYQGSAFAWNAFRQEKQIKEIKSEITKKGFLEMVG